MECHATVQKDEEVPYELMWGGFQDMKKSKEKNNIFYLLSSKNEG